MKSTKEYRSTYGREYRRKNKDKIKKYKANYRQTHAEQIRLYLREYRRRHRKPQEELDKTRPYHGYNAELKAMEFLQTGYHLTKDNWNSPYDINWEGKKIDVKSSRAHLDNKRLYWRFRLRGKKHLIDFFLCVGYHNGKTKFFLVPYEVAPNQTMSVSITGKSKYYKFEMKKPFNPARSSLKFLE